MVMGLYASGTYIGLLGNKAAVHHFGFKESTVGTWKTVIIDVTMTQEKC